MRFTIKKDEFLKGLNITSRAVGNKIANPVLENLKIELNEKGMFITGSNYEITIRTFIPYKNGDDEIIRNFKEGSTLVKGKLITEMIRKMECDEIKFDIIDSTLALISDNKSQYKLNCVKAEEYPDLDLDPNGTELTLTKENFNAIVSQTAFAASIKEQRPILTAINLNACNGVLVATATDAARMARKEIQIADNVSFIANVPAKMMIEVDHLLENLDSIQIAFSDKKALFTLGRTVVATRLIAGDYPDTKNITPKVINYSLEINSNDLLKAIDRANVLSIDRANVVDVAMSEENVIVFAKSAQVGSAEENIEIFKYEGQPLKVSFNSEFVLAAVRALNCEDVTFGFVGEMKPFVIRNASDDSVVQVVTPVRTY